MLSFMLPAPSLSSFSPIHSPKASRQSSHRWIIFMPFSPLVQVSVRHCVLSSLSITTPQRSQISTRIFLYLLEILGICP